MYFYLHRGGGDGIYAYPVAINGSVLLDLCACELLKYVFKLTKKVLTFKEMF